jgi:predicted  nucleic acid-binding Zn-ribbon protein
MVRDRTLKKVNKVLLRVEKHIEETRDALEDLEIEFEVLKATVKRLKNVETAQEVPQEEIVEEVDLENTTIIRKF